MRSSEIRLRKFKLRLRDKHFATHEAPALPYGGNHFSRSWLFGAVATRIYLFLFIIHLTFIKCSNSFLHPWHYSPWWALSFFTILLQSFLCCDNTFQSITPILLILSSMYCSHLFLDLPFFLTPNFIIMLCPDMPSFSVLKILSGRIFLIWQNVRVLDKLSFIVLWCFNFLRVKQRILRLTSVFFLKIRGARSPKNQDWLKRLLPDLNFSYLNQISLLLSLSSYPTVLMRLGGYRSRHYTSRNISRV